MLAARAVRQAAPPICGTTEVGNQGSQTHGNRSPASGNRVAQDTPSQRHVAPLLGVLAPRCVTGCQAPISSTNPCSARITDCLRTASRSPSNLRVSDSPGCPLNAQAKQTIPTGLSGDPPVGPAPPA